MRILFVLEYFHPYIGGVEFLFWQLSNALIRQGHQVKIITTWFDQSLPAQEHINGIEIQRVHCKNRFSFFYKSIPAIFSNAAHYDLIHTTTYTASIPAWFVSFLKRKKCILTFHEFWGSLWDRLPYLTTSQRFLYKSFERMITLLPFHKIIAVSDFTKSSLLQAKISSARMIRIYNGLDYQKIEQIKAAHQQAVKHSPPLVFTFVGRLGVSKGLDILLPAADLFLQEHTAAQLKLIIPKRPTELYRSIKKEIASMVTHKQVKVMHHLPKEQLYKEIQNSNFLVVPSYSEGFCFLAAETCALGVPLISSPCGALPEVVSGKHIFLETLSSAALLVALQKAANNQWMEKDKKEFPLSNSILQYIELYKQLINE